MILNKRRILILLVLVLILPSLGSAESSYGPKIKEEGYEISRSIVKREISKKGVFEDSLKIKNLRNTEMRVEISLEGEISEIIKLKSSGGVIPPDNETEMKFVIKGVDTGHYHGDIRLSGGVDIEIPVNISVTSSSLSPAFLVNTKLREKNIKIGELLKFKLIINKLKPIEIDNISLVYSVVGKNNSYKIREERKNLTHSVQLAKELSLPSELGEGDYFLEVNASYEGETKNTKSSFMLERPFLKIELFGFLPMWALLSGIAIITISGLSAYLIKRHIEKKKKYKMSLDKNKIPSKKQENFWLGKIAESNQEAYLEPEQLKTHTIVAGSTGGGKSITGQVIIEEALKRDVAVIVFDPTAQWSGMLRKCTDESMLSYYSKFGLKPSDAQAFKGNVRQVEDAREIIEIEKYTDPGKIQIFTLNKLDPEDIDLFVANVIRQIFKSDPKEAENLKLLLVFDEVHRLLSKFGGSGEGFLQIERACREFRKWGMGVMLISQVLSDFVEEVRANISTEIQMRTRDEGDLNRLKSKYGESFLQSLVKASEGVGMFVNPSYNHARPYFVNFRPILHNTRRLSDEELEKYNNYNEKVADLEYQIEQLKDEDVDTFDLKMELDLVKDKIMTGNFSVVDIYLESLKPRIEKQWKKIGKKPKERKKKLASVKDIKKSVEKAKKEGEEYEEESGEDEEEKEEVSLEEKQISPLTFDNGMMVSSLKELKNVLPKLNENIFESHVNEDKNEIAEWLSNLSKKEAKKIESIRDKEEMVEKLKEIGKEEDKKEDKKEGKE